MFCNHCGKSIAENSLYCSHCGREQGNVKRIQEEQKLEKTTANKNFIKENKAFVIFYLVWFFIHLIFVSVGEGDEMFMDGFWPFDHSDIGVYDKTEFVFYLIAPIVIWGIWKLVGKDIKKSIDNF